jgi:hypothetical protein
MKKGCKIVLLTMIAAFIVVAIIDIKLCNYKDAFYMMMQAFWLGLYYYALYGWSKSQKLNEQILQEWNKTIKSFEEALRRERIAHELIADLRKRLEKQDYGSKSKETKR